MNQSTDNILNFDTHFDITWIDFIEIAKAYGFKSGYCQKFTGTAWSCEGVEEEEIIFFHEEKGLILHAESYSGKSVNSAHVYGEVKIGDKLEEKQWYSLSYCSNGYNVFRCRCTKRFPFYPRNIIRSF